MNDALLARLQEIRQLLRRTEIISGLCRSLLTLLAILALFFIIDRLILTRLFEPGTGEMVGRGIMDGAAILCLLWVIMHTLFRELRMTRSDDSIAMKLEQAYPALDGRLISSVQLVRHVDQEHRLSLDLIRALTRETVQRCQPLDFSSIINKRRLAILAAATSGSLALTIALVCWQINLANVFLDRLLLGVRTYPTAASIVRVVASSRAGLGDSFPIEIEMDGARAIPKTATAIIRSSGQESADLQLDREPERGDGRIRFKGVIAHALHDFSFRPRALDAQWPNWIDVHLIPRPLISALHITCSFPAYLRRNPETTTIGDLRVPVGSKVHIHADVSKPLASSTLVKRFHSTTSATTSAMAETSSKMSVGADRTSIEGDFEVTANGTYSIQLLDDDGFEGADPIVYTISAITDHAPIISIQFPGHDKLATKSAQWPIRFTVSDDHGIVSGWIKYMLEPDDQGEHEIQPSEAPPVVQKIGITGLAGPGELEVHREVILNLGKLGVSEGMKVVYWIEATDNCQPVANIGVSPRYTFSVVDQSKLTERFEHEKSQLLSGIENLRDRQSEMKSVTETIRKVAP